MSAALPIAGPDAAPLTHRFRSAVGDHLLVVPYSRIFDIEKGGDLSGIDIDALAEPEAHDDPLDRIDEPAPQSISLNVSSSCNLGCHYCYASRGNFGGAQQASMKWSTAQAAIDRLVQGVNPAAPVTIGFLGGEPFVNRGLIHRTVAYAAGLAAQRGLDIRYSVTTNGTLLEPADVALLQRHLFAVTVSLDGTAAVHDRNRPHYATGKGSWADAVARIAPLLAAPGRAKIAARVTVTRDHLDVAGALDALAGVGFPEVGFAPLRAGPPGSGALLDEDWPEYLAALVAASRRELERLREGLPLRLTNLAVALKQLHRGAASPFPCGAGGGYFSVAASGRWYACHRAIGKADYELGTSDGLDHERRRDFLRRRHVHAQPECGSCWARYLCSGGCHQEAGSRSAASCDFIRGWLSFCLATYCELGNERVPQRTTPASEVSP
jgi:uncharacterized protein